MRRPLEEIHASARRIEWDDWGNPDELPPFGRTEGDSAALKYEFWDSHEKSFPYLELSYRDLEGHPLWVPDDERTNFGPTQTAR